VHLSNNLQQIQFIVCIGVAQEYQWWTYFYDKRRGRQVTGTSQSAISAISLERLSIIEEKL